MQNKLQELTDKIYQEGLERGNEEAKVIIDDAKKEASQIIKSAKNEAERILLEAGKSADEIKKNTNSEIKLSSKQALNALKQQISNVINENLTNELVSKAFDVGFTKKIVDTTIKNWSSKQSSDLNILLPKEDEKELSDYFKKSLKDFLDKGLELRFDSSVKSGFQISPKDGSYKVSFTEQDFENFFKIYLRPKLIDLLFQE